MKTSANTAVCIIALLWGTAGAVDGWYRPGRDNAGNDENALPLRREVILEPTRFMVVPTTQVLDGRQYVVSFHELSYGIDRNIQLMLNPWVNQRAGRILLGVKFSLRYDMAFGAGFIDQSNMFGLFLVKSFLQKDRTCSYGILDCQMGSDFTGEGGIGTEFRLTENVKVIGEALLGNSGEATRYDRGDLDLNIGLRYMWPANRPLKIDFGMNLIDVLGNTRANLDGRNSDELFQLIYIDVSYSSMMR